MPLRSPYCSSSFDGFEVDGWHGIDKLYCKMSGNTAQQHTHLTLDTTIVWEPCHKAVAVI